MRKERKEKINATINAIEYLFETTVTIIIAILIIFYRILKKLCKKIRKGFSIIRKIFEEFGEELGKAFIAIMIVVLIILWTLEYPQMRVFDKYDSNKKGCIKSVTYKELNVREYPSFNADVIKVLKRGDTVELSGYYRWGGEHTWYQINYIGWVSDVGLS